MRLYSLADRKLKKSLLAYLLQCPPFGYWRKLIHTWDDDHIPPLQRWRAIWINYGRYSIITHILFPLCTFIFASGRIMQILETKKIQRYYNNAKITPHFLSAPNSQSKLTRLRKRNHPASRCRKLPRSSSTREWGQSNSALGTQVLLIRHSVRLIGHFCFLFLGVWTPCTTLRPGLRVFFCSAFSFDHVTSTLYKYIQVHTCRLK